MPIQDDVIEDIRQATLTDPALRDVIHFYQSTWLPVNDLPSDMRLYAHSKNHLTYGNGILMFDKHVVVPSTLRSRILDVLHAAHQGIVKSHAKARQTIWWPKIGACIKQHIGACATCMLRHLLVVEPPLSSQLPNYPWQKVVTDLFEHNSKHYIVVVDLYSRYLELDELRSQTAAHVINTLKAIFARHGIPAEVRSDNGPCYAAHDFQLFAKSYGFNHVISSPRFPQANGEAEQAVEIAMEFLRKVEDPYLALPVYRSTPNHTGYSPAQLLMGRQLRSTVPTTIAALRLQTLDATQLQLLDHKSKEQQAKYYTKRHRTREQPSRQVDEELWVPDLCSRATNTELHPFRSH